MKRLILTLASIAAILIVGGLSVWIMLSLGTVNKFLSQSALLKVASADYTANPAQHPSASSPLSPLSTPTAVSTNLRAQVSIVSVTKVTDEYLPESSIFGMSWNPQGTHLILALSTGEYLTNEAKTSLTPLTRLLLVNPMTGESKVVAENGRFPVWSPSGQKIAYTTWQEVDKSAVLISDLSQGTTLSVIEKGVFAQWLSDQKLLVVNADNSVSIVDIESNSRSNLNITVSTNGPNSILISPDRTWLAVVKERNLSLLKLNSLDPAQVVSDTFTDIIGALAWSPKSDKLAFVENKAIQIVQIDNIAVKNKVYEWQGRGFPSGLNWSADGAMLALNSPEGIELVRADSSAHIILLSNKVESSKTYYNPQWSPSGDSLIVAGNDTIWNVTLSIKRQQ